MILKRNKKKILIFIGTQVEAIRILPLVKCLRREQFDVEIGLSGQHLESVIEVLDFFGETALFNLRIQNHITSAEDILAMVLPCLCLKLRMNRPDLILVHGDSTSTLAGALAGHYEKIPIGHIDAGLSTTQKRHQWFVDRNRALIAQLSSLHFTSTEPSARDLVQRGFESQRVFVTGNTVIDSLLHAQDIIQREFAILSKIERRFRFLNPQKKWILLANYQQKLMDENSNGILKSVLDLSQRSDVEVVCPIFFEMQLSESLKSTLVMSKNIHLINGINFQEMIWFMSRSYLIISESGGVEEEAPTFKVPTLVTCAESKRPEAVDSGWSIVVGPERDSIVTTASAFLDNPGICRDMKEKKNPFGDGYASVRIAQIVESLFKNGTPLDEDISASSTGYYYSKYEAS